MRLPSLTTLIGDEIEGDDKWSAFVDGKNGFFYGIPCDARRVVKFNPLDKSLTEIGPDLGEGTFKWRCGVLANSSSIYCAPYNADHILKIDTIQGTVETLDNLELPETGLELWASGALAADNNIYYMPAHAHQIMRLDPNNDSLSSVGDDLGYGWKYSGTVVGNDDHVYGMPYWAKRIIKFDPTKPDTISTVGEEVEEGFYCWNGLLAGDGYIYAVNESGQVLQIDTTNGNYTWIGDPIYSGTGNRWGGPIIGVDKCIYWPPFNANRVLMFDPETHQLPSLVGDDFGRESDKWQGGALATDGVIYCIPFCSSQVLAIDPLKEFSSTLQTNMALYPNDLGRLFMKDEEQSDETFFESSLRKFGGEKVFELVEDCLPLDAEWADGANNNGNLPPFMVAASCENCAASVIYYLLRRNVNGFLGNI
jgi:outer membrane protein assembly factor BamB